MIEFGLVLMASVLLAVPLGTGLTGSDAPDPEDLPEYTGDPEDPDLRVLKHGDGYIIVVVNGEYYVIHTD